MKKFIALLAVCFATAGFAAEPAKKEPAKKKKPVSEEARDMGLIYIGGGKYATRGGVVTHLNENGKLLPFINRNTDIA